MRMFTIVLAAGRRSAWVSRLWGWRERYQRLDELISEMLGRGFEITLMRNAEMPAACAVLSVLLSRAGERHAVMSVTAGELRNCGHVWEPLCETVVSDAAGVQRGDERWFAERDLRLGLVASGEGRGARSLSSLIEAALSYAFASRGFAVIYSGPDEGTAAADLVFLGARPESGWWERLCGPASIGLLR